MTTELKDTPTKAINGTSGEADEKRSTSEEAAESEGIDPQGANVSTKSPATTSTPAGKGGATVEVEKDSPRKGEKRTAAPIDPEGTNAGEESESPDRSKPDEKTSPPTEASKTAKAAAPVADEDDDDDSIIVYIDYGNQKAKAPEPRVQEPLKYYAIRKCDALSAPAIFMNWDDCSFYLDKEENEAPVEFKAFDQAADAVAYIQTFMEQANNDNPGGEKVLWTGPREPVSRRQMNFNAKYDCNLPRLREYRKQYGHVDVPESNKYSSDEFKGLGYWLGQMRNHMQRFEQDPRTSNLDSKRYQDLCALGLSVEKPKGRRSVSFTARFEQNLPRFRAFVNKFGHDDVPENHLLTSERDKERFSDLHEWVKQMRRQYKKFIETPEESLLDQPRFDLLTASGMQTHRRKKRPAPYFPPNLQSEKGNHTDVTEEEEDNNNDNNTGQPSKKRRLSTKKMVRDDPMWDEMYQKLKEFKEKHGHTNVPDNPRTDLRNFILRMRSNYVAFKEGKPTVLTAEKIAQLTQVGFELQPPRRLTWEERALQWLEYKTKHGRDPKSDSDDGLGQWVRKMRRQFRLMKNGLPHPSLTKEQADRLTTWGFTWNNTINMPLTTEPHKSWDERFAEVLEYKRVHGDMLVPQSYPVLGQWTKRMRAEYKKYQRGAKSRLKTYQIERLQEAGFHFQVRESRKKRKPEDDSRPTNSVSPMAQTTQQETETGRTMKPTTEVINNTTGPNNNNNADFESDYSSADEIGDDEVEEQQHLVLDNSTQRQHHDNQLARAELLQQQQLHLQQQQQQQQQLVFGQGHLPITMAQAHLDHVNNNNALFNPTVPIQNAAAAAAARLTSWERYNAGFL